MSLHCANQASERQAKPGANAGFSLSLIAKRQRTGMNLIYYDRRATMQEKPRTG